MGKNIENEIHVSSHCSLRSQRLKSWLSARHMEEELSNNLRDYTRYSSD